VPSWGGVRRYSNGKPGARTAAAKPKDEQFFASGVDDDGLKKRLAADEITDDDLKKLADRKRYPKA
jgi:hypothetical protein